MSSTQPGSHRYGAVPLQQLPTNVPSVPSKPSEPPHEFKVPEIVENQRVHNDVIYTRKYIRGRFLGKVSPRVVKISLCRFLLINRLFYMFSGRFRPLL